MHVRREKSSEGRFLSRGQSTANLAAGGVVSALSAAVAPMITASAPIFRRSRADFVVKLEKSPTHAVGFDLFTLHALTFFFALAAVIGLLSLTFLAKVREVGEAEDRVALQSLRQELRRSMQGLSSIAGLARLARFPVSSSGPGASNDPSAGGAGKPAGLLQNRADSFI